MQETFRKSHLTIALFGPLAVAAGVGSYLVGRPQILEGAELAVPDTGTGAGNTTILVKVNGTAVIPATSLAGAGTTKAITATASTTGGPGVFPAGVRLNKGDLVTVDVTAVPATTTPKGANVYLNLIQLDS